MKRVLIDNSPLNTGHAGRGIGAYVRGLESGFAQIKSSLEITFGSPMGAKADLIHYPYFDLFWRTLKINSTPVVVTIHDLIPLKYPKYFPAGIRGKFNWQLQRRSLSKVAAVVTDSLASKKDIIKFTGIAEDKIFVVYLAADQIFAPVKSDKVDKFRKEHGFTGNVFGYVGDINFNKNLPNLIRAVANVADAKLALVTRADLSSAIPEAVAIKQAISDSKIGNRLLLPKIETARDLVDFYASLDWYIQPSIDEGFGLPVLEAMQTGCPVLVARAGSLPEVTGKAGVYFDPCDINDMSEKITQALLMSPKQRQEYVDLGLTQAKRFSWIKMAQELTLTFNKILNLQ